MYTGWSLYRIELHHPEGVTIGENSMIGASSVVSKDIPLNQMWGNLIRFIKTIEDLDENTLKVR